MLCINESSETISLLSFRDNMKGQGCFAARFGTIYFYNPPPWDSPYAEGEIKAQ